MDKRKHIPFIIIIGLFLIVKLSLLFLAIDELIYYEEYFRAFIAKQLIDGPTVSLFFLQCDSYDGGSLVVGLLMVPIFKLFGGNLISVKLVALSFTLSSLILLYLLCNKFFNRRVAMVTSLLFIFSPPLFTKYSLITIGDASDSFLLSILFIFVFFKIFFNGKNDNIHFILLGLIGGLGTWFTFAFSITLLTCLIFWFLLDRGFFLRKSFLIFLITFILGFSPWIYYNISYDFIGLSIKGRSIFPSFSKAHLLFSLTKLKNFLLNDIRNSFLFDDLIFLKGKYLSALYFLIFVVSSVFLFWLNRWHLYLLIRRFIPLKRFQISYDSIPKEVLFLIYIIIFSLTYSFSNFEVNPPPLELAPQAHAIPVILLAGLPDFVGYRYLVPLYPFIFLLIASFISRVQEREIKGKVFVYSFSLITILSIGLVSNLKLISFNKIDKRSFNVDYDLSYLYLGSRIGKKYEGDIDKCINLIYRLEEKYRSPLYRGLGLSIAQWHINDIEKCIELINRVEERYRFHLYKGLGFVIARRFGDDIEKCIELINRVEERYRFHLYEGLGFVIARRFGDDIEKCIELINRVEERYRFHLYKRLGFVIARRFGDDIEKCIELINRVEERYRFHIFRGLGFVIAWKFRNDMGKCISLINKIEEKYRAYVYEGLGAGVAEMVNGTLRQFYGIIASYRNIIDCEKEKYKIAFYKGLGKCFNWQRIWRFNLSKYNITIEREVEERYKSYVYEGLENPLEGIYILCNNI